MTEEPLLLLEHLIQTSIQRVLFYQRKIFIQQISHCALLKPLPMQPPFAPRINESIADQGLQNMLPASSLSTIGQTLGPEIIQAQLLVKITGQPTGSPLPGPMQFHLFEPDRPARQSRRRSPGAADQPETTPKAGSARASHRRLRSSGTSFRADCH